MEPLARTSVGSNSIETKARNPTELVRNLNRHFPFQINAIHTGKLNCVSWHTVSTFYKDFDW